MRSFVKIFEAIKGYSVGMMDKTLISNHSFAPEGVKHYIWCCGQYVNLVGLEWEIGRFACLRQDCAL